MTIQIALVRFCFTVRKPVLAFSLALCSLAIGLPLHADDAHITTFDVPASNGYGTQPVGINFERTIVGIYADANFVYHGFLRNREGKYTTFDAPDAGTTANNTNGTFPSGINVWGIVAGYYNDVNIVSHGFLRTPDGTFKTFDAPGADTNPADAAGTIVTGVNDLGLVTGYFFDSNFRVHGFLRCPDGKFTTFDAPGDDGQGTIANGPANLEGAIPGFFMDANLLWHGFVRSPDGHFAIVTAPDACTGGISVNCDGTGVYNINIFGMSVGAYVDNNLVAHGFLRSADGTLKTFEAPGAGTGPSQGTIFFQVAGLNNSGAVTASYCDANGVFHGFLRGHDGHFTTFDAPGADLTPGDSAGTFPVSLNDSGVITGFYIDSNFVFHGFVRTHD